jgi:hypothetical protein
MKKRILWFALLGMAVAAALAAYAYYSNQHRGGPKIDESVYLVMCPPSIFLMLTESASVSGQVLIVAVVVVLNGLLYGAVAETVATWLRDRDS